MKKKTRLRYGELTPARPIAAVPQQGAHAHPAVGTSVVSPGAPAAAPIPDVPPPTPAVRAPRTFRERAGARVGRADVLMFRVGHEHFAVDLAAVEEAIDVPHVHHVPEMPAAMLGVIPVRGSLTSLYSPRGALGLPAADGQSALVFRRGQARIALSIDDVDDVVSVDLTTLRDAPDAAASPGLVLGVTRHGAGLVALLDADALLVACAASPLQETA